jgi:putative transposase
MPRRPRTHLDGFPLHIVQRSHNREACSFAEDDTSPAATGSARCCAKPGTVTISIAMATEHPVVIGVQQSADHRC